MHLFFCGDIMPGGVLPYQANYITPELQNYMRSFDFRIGTLEAAIGTGLPYDPVKMAGRQNIIFARNEDFFRVKEMGFDVVSLANNHVWDLGEEGLQNTIDIINKANIKYLGAGMNGDAASKPVILNKSGVSVAIFAYCLGPKYLGYVEFAGKDKAGTNPFDLEKVKEEIKNAKKEHDYVIVMPHWGLEYHMEPRRECMFFAKQMIMAGADAVLGSHPHVAQPCVKYKHGFICYSMGNFLFPDFYMYPPRPIWYPDSSVDLSQIEDIFTYPYPIEKPQRRVWKKTSRYGCVAHVTIEKECFDVTYKYVKLSQDNVVGLTDLDNDVRKSLSKATLLSKNSFIRRLVFLNRRMINKH